VFVPDIREKLENYTPELPELPQGEECPELCEPLYDSARGYYSQLVATKRFQNKYETVKYNGNGHIDRAGIGWRKANEHGRKTHLTAEQRALDAAALELQRQARLPQITSALQDKSLSAVERGQLLLEARPFVRKGFLQWIQNELPFTQPTARRYMQAAQKQKEQVR
jgi:hypothetical protein